MRNLAALILLSFIWCSACFAFNRLPDISDAETLPTFDVPTLNGKSHFKNSTLDGQVSLLNIWATWCGYCKLEHHMLMKIKNEYHVPIFGLTLRDNPKATSAWLKSSGNPYTVVGVDYDGSVAREMEVYGTPATFILDKQGKIRYRYSGAIDQGAWDSLFWPIIQKLRAENP